MSRVFALLWKDLRLFLADRKALLITFAVPIGIASFFGTVFGGPSIGAGSTKKIPVLIVDEDRSVLVGGIVDGLRAGALVAPTVVPEAEAARAVKDGKASVAVVFPKGFAKSAPKAMFSGTAPVVELRYDPSKSLEMQAVQGSIMEIAMRKVSAEAFSPRADYSDSERDVQDSKLLTPDQKARFHDFFGSLRGINGTATGGSGNGGSGGMRQPFTMKAAAQTASHDPDADRKATLAHTFAGMAMQGVLFFGINAAMGLLADRRKGIWRRLRAAPIGLTELLVGKALSIAAIGSAVLVGVLLFGMVAFGIRVSGSPLGLGAVLVACALMTASFGLLVASLGRTEEQSRGLSILAVLTMTMLGGAWFPTFMMPGWVQTLSLVVPVRWALDGFDAMLWRGGGFGAALVPVAGLLFFSLVFGAVAAFRFRTMPESA